MSTDTTRRDREYVRARDFAVAALMLRCMNDLHEQIANALAAAREEGRIEERATLGRLPHCDVPFAEIEEGSEDVPDLSDLLAAARREGASEGAEAERSHIVERIKAALDRWAVDDPFDVMERIVEDVRARGAK